MAVKERIDIVVPEGELSLNDERRVRLRRARGFDPTDRVPVALNVCQWVALAARGVSPGEYVRSPRDNLRQQLLNHKWRVENVRDDSPIPTTSITIVPDLGCLRGCEFEMEVTWPEDQPPKCTHPLTDPRQMDSLEVPDPAGGLNATKEEWRKEMLGALDGFDVRLNGERLAVEVGLGSFGGPIPSAFALCGSNLFLWMMTDPRRVHRLMDVVARSHVRVTRHFDELLGRPAEHPLGMGADSAELVGPEAFREFVVPYYLKVWESYPGPRGLHMCGKTDHLLEILRDELRIDSFDGFGFGVDRDNLAEAMAGRVVLTGGPSPMLVQSGPPEAIVEACVSDIRKLGARGGFILSCGGGAAPHTPPEHFSSMVEASRRAAARATPSCG